jgi:hypothetical protein
MGEERYKLYLLARLYVIESRYESSKLFGGFQMKGNPERLQFRSHPGKEYNFNKTSPERMIFPEAEPVEEEGGTKE